MVAFMLTYTNLYLCFETMATLHVSMCVSTHIFAIIFISSFMVAPMAAYIHLPLCFQTVTAFSVRMCPLTFLEICFTNPSMLASIHLSLRVLSHGNLVPRVCTPLMLDLWS